MHSSMSGPMSSVRNGGIFVTEKWQSLTWVLWFERVAVKLTSYLFRSGRGWHRPILQYVPGFIKLLPSDRVIEYTGVSYWRTSCEYTNPDGRPACVSRCYRTWTFLAVVNYETNVVHLKPGPPPFMLCTLFTLHCRFGLFCVFGLSFHFGIRVKFLDVLVTSALEWSFWLSWWPRQWLLWNSLIWIKRSKRFYLWFARWSSAHSMDSATK
jgi:hypothetical protein